MVDENKFILGIDLGNLTSTVSYFNFNQMSIDIVDISGGYGKSSIPTVVSYSFDSDEWIFGEYAILIKSFDNYFTIENIVDNLGKNISYSYKSKNISLTFALSKFLLFLIESVKNINPNANIEGIVLSIFSYSNEKVIEDIKESFRMANMENLILKIVDDRECILENYLYKNKTLGDKVLILDYSNRQLRTYIFEVESKVNIKCIKTCFKDELGQKIIYDRAKNLIIKKFMEETGKVNLTEYEKSNLDIFVYQQFDIIFQRKNFNDIKLYYNFYYPPFQKVISKQEIFNIISYFEIEINLFFNNLFEDLSFNKNDIKDIILTGGGTEIYFIDRLIKTIFNLDKNFKGTLKRNISDGACIIACQELNIMPKTGINIKDLNKINYNIGVFSQRFKEEKFISLVFKNSFIWQKNEKRIFNITSKDSLDFGIFIEYEKEKFKLIKNISVNLDEFCDRDIKTIRLAMYIQFKNIKEMVFTIEDFGFGDIYEKIDFKREYLIKLDTLLLT